MVKWYNGNIVFGVLFIDGDMVQWILHEYDKMMKLENTMVKSILWWDFNVSCIIGLSEVYLVLIQCYNSCYHGDNRTSRLCYMRTEGLFLASLIFSLFSFPCFLMSKWCDGEKFSNGGVITVWRFLFSKKLLLLGVFKIRKTWDKLFWICPSRESWDVFSGYFLAGNNYMGKKCPRMFPDKSQEIVVLIYLLW